MIKEKLYFLNLNGLRFIAAMMVLIPHIEELKSIYKIDNYLLVIKTAYGHLGVILFFVLSGFLITYLLLMEEKANKTIAVSNFYIRRILRIWPLYFLIIVLALFVLPQFSFFTIPGFSKEAVWKNLGLKIVLYFTFFANVVLAFVGLVPYASQTWSIGTEEQFYLVWPIIMKFKNKRKELLMIFIIIFYLVIERLLESHYLNFLSFRENLAEFWSTRFKIDCMAIGGLFAVLSFNQHKILKFIQNKITFVIVLMFTITIMIVGYNFPFYNFGIFSFLFGLIILNFAQTKELPISLENNVLNYLGKISFGLYMFHIIAVVTVIKVGMRFNLTSNYFLYPSSIVLTIILSSLSYHFFESKFLLLKGKFSTINSG